jgi:hypothetical protein
MEGQSIAKQEIAGSLPQDLQSGAGASVTRPMPQPALERPASR